MPYSKQCFKCKILKPIDEFYKHKMMKDGHLNKCKECAKRDIRIFRRDNEHVRQYDRERYLYDDQRKQSIKDVALDWKEKNPDAYYAHNTVAYNIKIGILVRQPCKICGDLNVHAHHKNYNKPLEVEWYCARHHSKQHNPEIM